MRLVYYDRAHATEGADRPRTHAQGLNHGNHEILALDLERVLLDAADGGTRTKLTDTLDPLIGQKALVDDDHCPSLESGRERQGADRFAHPHIEGQYSSTCFDSSGYSLVLVRS